MKEAGASRQKNEAVEKNASRGTEIKRREPDVFAHMAYLGKSADAKEEVSVKEVAEKKSDDKRSRKNDPDFSVNAANKKEKIAAEEKNAQKDKPVVKKNKATDRSRFSGKAAADDRKRLRDEQIAKANEYLLENPEKEKRASPKTSARSSGKKTAAEKSEKNETSVELQQENAKGKKGQRGKNKKPVKVLFLGGVGEIGKNMTAIEYGNDIIVIDAGLSFPDEEMPGVDLVVPDVSYLAQNKEKIKGILITHGHEDHIGGLPYLLKQIDPKTPIYGTKLTLALADNKIKEHRIQGVSMITKQSGDKFKVGCFEIELVNVNHSISGAVAFAITTPYGVIYHSGDFKIDLTPVAGQSIDLNRVSEIGGKGVVLYLGESTNIERPGYTMSETVVGTTFDHLFAENTTRRIVIATFASNVHRLKQIIDVAVRYRRKVVLSGRSMFNVVEAASKIGELTIPEGVLVDVEKIKNYFDNEIVIISTGTQGEPMSALTRMANGEFNKVTIGSNDTVIISATPIPGNEKMIYRVINNLYKKGANVVYESLEKVHVSGHACQEEHKIMHKLLRPKFFIPVHGEYRHLKRHALLAEELGMDRSHIIIPEIGNCVELTDSSLKLGNNFAAGVTIIDGSGSEDFSTSAVMKDRKQIAGEGMFVVALTLSGGAVVGDPVIKNKGVMLSDERNYEAEMLNIVKNILDKTDLSATDPDALSTMIEKGLHDYLIRKTKQSPLILPVIMYI